MRSKQMRQICRSVPLVLVAALAIGALAAASSSAALPEFYGCVSVKAGTGKYNSGCTEENKSGSFEKKPLEKSVSFTVAASEIAIETDDETLLCKTFAGTGETKGTREVANTKGQITGSCTENFADCGASGAGENEWKTEPLVGRLGYIEKSTKKVGLLLEPAKGKVMAPCVLGALEGSVIGEISSGVGSMVKELHLTYKSGVGGDVQEFTKFEGEEATHSLTLRVFEGLHQAALEAKVGVQLKEPLEVRG